MTHLLLFVVVQSLSCVWLFLAPWTAGCQASLSSTMSQSFLKLMSIESVMRSHIAGRIFTVWATREALRSLLRAIVSWSLASPSPVTVKPTFKKCEGRLGYAKVTSRSPSLSGLIQEGCCWSRWLPRAVLSVGWLVILAARGSTFRELLICRHRGGQESAGRCKTCT